MLLFGTSDSSMGRELNFGHTCIKCNICYNILHFYTKYKLESFNLKFEFYHDELFIEIIHIFKQYFCHLVKSLS